MEESPRSEGFSPEEVEKATFSVVESGYDKDEVEVFLHSVAQDMAALLSHRSARPYEALGREMGALMQHAQDAAARVRKEADTEAATVLQEAHKTAKKAREEAAALKREA
jgi:DivIVA domain-containing protein